MSSESDLPEPVRAAANLLFNAWGAISCAHGTFHCEGYPDNPDGDPGMASMLLSMLAAELQEHGQGVRDGIRHLDGKCDIRRLSSVAGTSMFDAVVKLAERLLDVTYRRLEREMSVATPTGPTLDRFPQWSDVPQHWPAIQTTLQDFPEFNLDEAQAMLRSESKQFVAEAIGDSQATLQAGDAKPESLGIAAEGDIKYRGDFLKLGLILPFHFFEALLAQYAKYVPTQALIDDVWDDDMTSDKAVHQVARRLRKALNKKWPKCFTVDGETKEGHYRLTCED